MAIDREGRALLVWSAISERVTAAPLDPTGFIGSVHLESTALSVEPPSDWITTLRAPERSARAAELDRGRHLFYGTGNRDISSDGSTCASCHIDGRDDGITWSTPKGPRQTPMLAGRVSGSAPYGWAGDAKTLEGYIQNTVLNLGGRGMDDEDAGEIAAYLEAAPTPRRPALDGALAARGGQLFVASGCAGCHAGGESTHQLAIGVSMRDDTLGWLGVDTPSLRFVAGTAPYFHDGRYRTLEDLLADPRSQMGKSASLPAGDRAALAAYLRSL
jgi:mono/diheme cytochrome c family protein